MPKGLLVTVRTGSGQGDPISSILFLLATEPLNRILDQNYRTLSTQQKEISQLAQFSLLMTTSILYQSREQMIYNQSTITTTNTQW